MSSDEEKFPASNSSSGSTALQSWQIRSMLEDIEGRNGSRKDIKFLHVCNEDKSLYGEKGSEKRRKFQVKWGRLAHMPIHKYANELEAHIVEPNSVTKWLLRSASPTPAKAKKAKNGNEFESLYDDDNEGAAGVICNLNEDFANLSQAQERIVILLHLNVLHAASQELATSTKATEREIFLIF
mmetsp:Transcript_901/g.1290  ORF Transcript_901/g.1290 Transcript_901/m.1290 type:complete len:183 (-) Transcript_901:696-1244(-)